VARSSRFISLPASLPRTRESPPVPVTKHKIQPAASRSARTPNDTLSECSNHPRGWSLLQDQPGLAPLFHSERIKRVAMPERCSLFPKHFRAVAGPSSVGTSHPLLRSGMAKVARALTFETPNRERQVSRCNLQWWKFLFPDRVSVTVPRPS
jgi:hypothetical protein